MPSVNKEVAWNKMMEMGQARQGVVGETFTVRSSAKRPKHEPHAGACGGQVCATLRSMCVRRGVLSSPCEPSSDIETSVT